ncbi:diguanylate cyclase [Rheinheimera sp.]|uniref:diguanylate cyclase n=1 Tax=Rheinheimera sp. TaxID=1869214 RepID=UPI0023571B1E|nr:diguanylate cyclase [Rheinheimera sp.]|tara:strand:+ start:417 stop:1370 length:954 start_codon:yes stop_codon:yes gene_type:complete
MNEQNNAMSDIQLSDFPAFSEQAVILVVDDQPINIQVIYQILGGSYKILMATSGAQAIKVCTDSLPDLVLMDVLMPEQDGLETCRQMKAQETIADIPVIFVTAAQQQEEEDACWQAGAVDFIQKPVNANTLRHRVNAHLTLKKQSDLLRSLAFIDGLTHVYNRRYFDQFLQKQLAACKRHQMPLAVLLIDIDHFKLYNDHLGHLAGDDALRRVAAAMKACCLRPNDLIARYGGEEFVAVLPDTTAEGARFVAEKILTAITALAIPHPASQYGVISVSIGIAVADPRLGYEAGITERADKQLYLTKQRGRNGFSQETT